MRSRSRLSARRIVLLLPLVMLLGCDAVWNILNRGALRHDVMTLMGETPDTLGSMSCRMSGTTRDGTCLFHGSVDLVNRVARRVELRPWVPSPDEAMVKRFPYDGLIKNGCRSMPAFSDVFGPSPVSVYESVRRAPTLRLPSGRAFEYLVLFHNRQTDDACVDTSYAYG